ncbi:MAG: hypothetical protein K1X53_07195 [Candidatus Sumerlaeaceae bacterium]|nr:hypothetical protein [Candidatus Sumerlaeaceae bacterium]
MKVFVEDNAPVGWQERFREQGLVAQRWRGNVFMVRLAWKYPRGFAGLADGIWEGLSLELRKKWKKAAGVALGRGGEQGVTWREMVLVYRRVFWEQLVRDGTIRTGVPGAWPSGNLLEPVRLGGPEGREMRATIEKMRRQILNSQF